MGPIEPMEVWLRWSCAANFEYDVITKADCFIQRHTALKLNSNIADLGNLFLQCPEKFRVNTKLFVELLFLFALSAKAPGFECIRRKMQLHRSMKSFQ